MSVRIKYNDENDNLWCVGCKERIQLGEKYVEVIEECLGEQITKSYKMECAPEDQGDDDLIIDEEE